MFAAGLDDPHPGDDESRRREHAAANAASEAGTIQLAEREHTRSHTQTPSGRTIVSLRSPSRPEGAESASPRRVVSHESTRTPAPLSRVLLALGIARQAGFPERFIEVMTACWDNGSSRFLRHFAAVCEATQTLMSAQSSEPRPHHTRTRFVGAEGRMRGAHTRACAAR